MRLTPPGRFVAVLSVIALAAAYLLGYPRLAAIGIGGLVALVIGAAWVARRPPVTMTREIFPSRVTRGEPAVKMLFMHNASRWFGSTLEARERFGDTELAVPVPYLPAGTQRQIGYEVPTRDRGIIEVGPLRWEKSDALGLVRRQHALAGLELLYVHPRTHEFPLTAALRGAELFEEAVEIAASTVVAAARERLPARLLTSGGQTVASAGGHDDAGRFLDFLAGVGLSEETGLGQAAERLVRSESGGILVVATDSIEADHLVTLHRTSLRARPRTSGKD